jgi:hypothetical protein
MADADREIGEQRMREVAAARVRAADIYAAMAKRIRR